MIITLMILMILTAQICYTFAVTISAARNFQNIKLVNMERLQICLFLAYIKYTNKYDLLLSDYISFDDVIIDYTVDDMGDYYYINVSIVQLDHQTCFDLDLNKEQSYLTRFEYHNEK